MSLHFGTSNSAGKRFSIDDAFEEETDEAIRVYGSTETCSPVNSLSRIDSDDNRQEHGNRGYKLTTEASRDSDSLIQDCYDGASIGDTSRSCFRHPKVRENWRMVLAAATLLVVGVGLLATGALALADPDSGLQGAVFFLAGFICFVPGAYHVVYIYLAAKVANFKRKAKITGNINHANRQRKFRNCFWPLAWFTCCVFLAFLIQLATEENLFFITKYVFREVSSHPQ